MVLLVCVAGCSAKSEEPGRISNTESEKEDYIVVGFSQLGAESDWRNANTESVKNALTPENGFKLIFEDAQQKQTNQITAIRSFIQQEVDYIVVAPVMENGWDTVLSEAKEAGIPVIIIDRMVNVEDEDSFVGWFGSDFELEGLKVCEWINSYTRIMGVKPSDIHIVDIQGTINSTAQIGRTKGFSETADKYGWDIVAYGQGDFTKTKGREAMLRLLKIYDNINVVYCENDDEALGVIEAIESVGKKVGSDINNGEIMVVSFDGLSKEALRNLSIGKISCIGECNPDMGPKLMKYIETLEKNEEVDKYEYLDEQVFAYTDRIEKIYVGDKSYRVKLITKDELK